MHRTTRPLIRTATAAALTVAISLTGTGARADHGSAPRQDFRYDARATDRPSQHHRAQPDRQEIRVHIPVRQHGPETLDLTGLIRQHGRLRVEDYRLTAVVVSNGPFSNGYATLRTGHRKSDRYPLTGWNRVLIPAPAYGPDDWRLRLGPGTQVRTVTAVLVPRGPAGDAHRPWDRDEHRDSARATAERRAPVAGRSRWS